MTYTDEYRTVSGRSLANADIYELYGPNITNL